MLITQIPSTHATAKPNTYRTSCRKFLCLDKIFCRRKHFFNLVVIQNFSCLYFSRIFMCSLAFGGFFPLLCVLYLGCRCWLASGFDYFPCCQKFSGQKKLLLGQQNKGANYSCNFWCFVATNSNIQSSVNGLNRHLAKAPMSPSTRRHFDFL